MFLRCAVIGGIGLVSLSRCIISVFKGHVFVLDLYVVCYVRQLSVSELSVSV